MNEASSWKDFTPSAKWAEIALCRELYGTLQALATRPLAYGQQAIVSETQNHLHEIVRSLGSGPRRLLNDNQLHLFQAFLNQLEFIPPEVAARTLLRSIPGILTNAGDDTSALPCAYVARPPASPQLRRLVVTTGPTIGLGDEILVARALVEQAAAHPGLTIAVASRYYDLWACLGGPTELVGRPPLAGLVAIERLTSSERTATGHLFFDFLESDPSRDPYSGPRGIAFAARWAMGSRTGDFVDLERACLYALRYPDGFPECRFLESRWMARYVLPGAPTPLAKTMWSGQPYRREPAKILIQVRTTKPELMLPSTFYGDVMTEVAKDHALTVELLPAPDPSGQAIVERAALAISKNLKESVSTPPSTSLGGVFRQITSADVLLGPDTFSAHLAAVAGLPQVTISLPHHYAWVTLGAPCLPLYYAGPLSELTSRAARRVRAFLRLRRPGASVSAEIGQRWRDHLHQADRLALLALSDTGQPTCEETAEVVRSLRATFREHEHHLAHLLGEPLIPVPSWFTSFDPVAYPHDEDARRAFVRWYRALGSLDETALLAAA